METLINTYRGDIYSVLTAIIWGLAVVYYRRSGDVLRTVPLKVFQNAVTTLLFFICVILVGDPLWPTLSAAEWALMLGSAFVAIAIGETWYISAIRRIGAGPQAILDCVYSPSVIIIAYLFFDEQLPPLAAVGAVFVLAAIVISNTDLRLSNLPRRDLYWGLFYGLVSQVMMAVGVMMMKPLLWKAPLLTMMAYRFAFATLIVMIPDLLRGRHEGLFAGFSWNRNLQVLLTGAILGPFITTYTWFAGNKYTLAGKAAIYTQLSTVFIILFAAWLLKEHLTRRRLIAVGIALIGGALVAWSG